MLPRQIGDAVVNLVPHLVGRNWPQLAGRNFDGEIKLPLVPDIDDDRRGPTVSCKKVRDLLDRFLGSREPDAHE